MKVILNWLVISKLTWGIWWILTRAFESLKHFHINGLLFTKVYIVWAKKVQRSCLSWNWRGIQIWRGIDLFFQNWHQEFDKFRPEHSKSVKDFHFNGLLLSKLCIVWAKKVQRSYLSCYWRVMQNLKKNWLVPWKMTWGIWQIFTR